MFNGSGPFKQSLELKIKGDLIPEATAEEIIGELQALFARHNAGAALSSKAVLTTTSEFHTALPTRCIQRTRTWRSTRLCRLRRA